MLDLRRVLASKPKPPQDVELAELWTPWGEKIASGERDLGSAFASHPRPQLARERWMSLNGWWECAFVSAVDDGRGDGPGRAGGPGPDDGHAGGPGPDAGTGVDGASGARVAPADAWRTAAPPADGWRPIRVPFSPEAPLSGVGRQLLPSELLWYRRTLAAPDLAPGERVVLHLDAVDWACAVYANGLRVAEHVGGYLPFSADVTDALRPGENQLIVCVHDPSDASATLRGKQRLARGGIWYTAQSGIWQDVWLEVVPAAHVHSLSVDARPAGVGARVAIAAEVSGEGVLLARVLDGGREVARAEAPARDGRVTLALGLPEARPWSPGDPHLYDLELAFGRDRARSYFGVRDVRVASDARGTPRVLLNGSPVFLRGVLDQGYWPDGLMTAPGEEALAHDVRAARELGFNLLRMHIKVESARFYALCDRLGMLVWQDMVSGGDPGPYDAVHTSYLPTLLRASWSHHADTGPRAARQLSAASPGYRTAWRDACEGTVRLLAGHPCVIGWTLFNEGWGQFDARAAVEAVRSLDATRPVDATSGWYDRGCGDFFSVHNYFRPLEVWPDPAARRRGSRGKRGGAAGERDAAGEKGAHDWSAPAPGAPRAFAISEFGGVSCAVPGHVSLETSYGYEQAGDLPAFAREVCVLLARADALEAEGLAGYVYTQLSDVEEETNGLLTYDRRVNKLAPASDASRKAAPGPGSPEC